MNEKPLRMVIDAPGVFSYKVSCVTCGIVFKSGSSVSKYCSQKCRPPRKAPNLLRAFPSVPRELKGACGELHVSIDLLGKGFEVYRNISSHGSLDLVAYGKNGTLLKVEVTTGYTLNGKLFYGKHEKHKARFDVIAVVTPTTIAYFMNDKEFEPNGRIDTTGTSTKRE